MIISISINGVLRDILTKFQQVYEKYEDKEVKSNIITPDLMKYTHFETHEELYDFLYSEAPMEIFGQASEMENNVISHLVELYKNMPTNYKLIIASDALGKAKPSTLWFLAKYGLVCDEIIFYTTKTLSKLWKKTDLFITADVEVIKTKPKNKKLIIVDKIYNHDFNCDLKINNLKELDSFDNEYIESNIIIE